MSSLSIEEIARESGLSEATALHVALALKMSLQDTGTLREHRDAQRLRKILRANVRLLQSGQSLPPPPPPPTVARSQSGDDQLAYVLARDLGIQNHELLEVALSLGLAIESSVAWVSPSAARILRREVSRIRKSGSQANQRVGNGTTTTGDPRKNIRIADLAKELGLTVSELMALARVAGLEPSAGSSRLSAPDAEKLRDEFAARGMGLRGGSGTKSITLSELVAELGLVESELVELAGFIGVSVVPNGRWWISGADAERIRSEFTNRKMGPQGQTRVKKIRLSELARELGLTNKEALDLSKSMGIDVRNASSSMEEAQADRVRRKAEREGLKRDVQPEEEEVKKKAPTKQVSTSDRWPTLREYDQALRAPENVFTSQDLQAMSVLRSSEPLRSRIISAGGFAGVAKCEIGTQTWAIRMLLKQQDDIAERYATLERLRASGSLPLCFVETRYRESAIKVGEPSQLYPVIQMEWVDGTPLGTVLSEACDRGRIDVLSMIRILVSDLQSKLRESEIAHGDLSGSNIVVCSVNDEMELKLLDYDSFWSPECALVNCAVEPGELQHRLRPNPIGPHADDVAFAMIELTLAALIAQPTLGVGADFDQTFLCSQKELLSRQGEGVIAMHRANPDLFERLVEHLRGPYKGFHNVGNRLRGDQSEPSRAKGDMVSLQHAAHRNGMSILQLRKEMHRLGMHSTSEDDISRHDLQKVLLSLKSGVLSSSSQSATTESQEDLMLTESVASETDDSTDPSNGRLELSVQDIAQTAGVPLGNLIDFLFRNGEITKRDSGVRLDSSKATLLLSQLQDGFVAPFGRSGPPMLKEVLSIVRRVIGASRTKDKITVSPGALVTREEQRRIRMQLAEGLSWFPDLAQRGLRVDPDLHLAMLVNGLCIESGKFSAAQVSRFARRTERFVKLDDSVAVLATYEALLDDLLCGAIGPVTEVLVRNHSIWYVRDQLSRVTGGTDMRSDDLLTSKELARASRALDPK